MVDRKLCVFQLFSSSSISSSMTLATQTEQSKCEFAIRLLTNYQHQKQRGTKESESSVVAAEDNGQLLVATRIVG